MFLLVMHLESPTHKILNGGPNPNLQLGGPPLYRAARAKILGVPDAMVVTCNAPYNISIEYIVYYILRISE